jgi:hypothetical protein
MITDTSEEKKINDPMFNKSEIVEKYGQNTFLVWQLMNRMGPISPRDFLYVIHGNILEDGTHVLTCYSIEDPIKPPQKGVVRGVIHRSGYILKPLPDGQTETTFIAQVDMKGFIPKFAINLAASMVGFSVGRLWKTMDYFQERGGLWEPPAMPTKL